MKKLLFPVICFVAMLFGTTVNAYSQTPEQLQMMQSMSPSELQKLKKQYEQTNGSIDTKDFDTKGKSTTVGTSNMFSKDPEKYKREIMLGVPLDTLPAGSEFTEPEIYIEPELEKQLLRKLEKQQQAKEDSIDGISMPIFGRDMFNVKNLTFAPSLNIPTPSDYSLAAGDEVIVNLWGAAEEEYKINVTPDGYIRLEGVGLIKVGGKSFESAAENIKSTLSSRFEGISNGDISVNVSLGNIRSITINITGEARMPGTYNLPSLSTLFNAIYVAGGINTIGSLREIELYRAGKKVATLDIYKYMLEGDTRVNVPLKDNDLIVVKPYQNLVQIAGAVKRPMTYELKDSENVSDLLKFTGGFNGLAYNQKISVDRSATGRAKQIFTVDKVGFPYFVMMDRDSVTVARIHDDKFENRISIEGAVWQPGNYQVSDSIGTLKQLIEAADGLMPEAYMGRALIQKQHEDMTFSMQSVNLSDIINGKELDVKLDPNDHIVVFPKDYFKQKQSISVLGEVNNPKEVSFAKNMTMLDAIALAGGLNDAASTAKIEVARRVSNPESLHATNKLAEVFSMSIDGSLEQNELANNFQLQPFDIVYVRKSPEYVEQLVVTITGEVQFEGEYVLSEASTTLSQIIGRAGGFSQFANSEGAYLRRLKTEFDLERDKSLEMLNKVDQKNAKDTSLVMKEKIKVNEYYAVGINLRKALAEPNSVHDIQLQEGDKLVVPKLVNTVKITGAVYYPNTVSYQPEMSVKKYIEMAGGYSQRAKKKPFVIHQNGMVTRKGKLVKPGSEIVVPFKPEREPMSVAEWVGIGTSAISMATMITSLTTSLK